MGRGVGKKEKEYSCCVSKSPHTISCHLSLFSKYVILVVMLLVGSSL